MARPFKQGLEYFPLDVSLFEDSKIRNLQIECGYLGILVYIRILTLVYANGYFLETSVENLAKVIFHDFQNRSLRRVEKISEVIRSLAKCDLLDTRLMTADVITSFSIQKQWLTSVSRRKNIDKSKYWLLSENDEAKIKNFNDSCDISSLPNLVNVDSNSVNVNNNSINVSNNTQKEKEKKKEKKSDKPDKFDKRSFGFPKLHFITECLLKNEYIKETDLKILEYDQLIKEVSDSYSYEIVLSAINYITKYAKTAEPPIIDKFNFFKESLWHNSKMLQRENEGGSAYGEENDDIFEKLG